MTSLQLVAEFLDLFVQFSDLVLERLQASLDVVGPISGRGEVRRSVSAIGRRIESINSGYAARAQIGHRLNFKVRITGRTGFEPAACSDTIASGDER